MPSTSVHALRYPLLGDNPNVPLDLQRLADDTERELVEHDTVIAAMGAWTDYTPTLKTHAALGTALPSSVGYARWTKVGKTVMVTGQVSNTGAAVVDACVALPLAAGTPAFRNLNCGTLTVFLGSGGAPADQAGVGYMTSDIAHLVVVADTGGFRDCPAGAAIRYSVTYEVL